MMEAGIEGTWTPLLVPRMGYCDYSCNACGLSCPVEAIPPLSLEEKRVQVMGKASVDRNRCLAWAEDTPCIVCEEMCPLPEKAIVLEEAEIWDSGDLESFGPMAADRLVFSVRLAKDEKDWGKSDVLWEQDRGGQVRMTSLHPVAVEALIRDARLQLGQ